MFLVGFASVMIMTRYDPILLSLQVYPTTQSNEKVTKWREASAQTKGTLKLLLSQLVQIRAGPLLDDASKRDYIS